MLAQCFTDNVEPIRQGGIPEDLLGRTSFLRPDGGHHRFLWIDELNLRPCKGGRQAANGAPLDCCIAILRIEELKGDGTGFGALGAHAMSDCLLCVLRYEAFSRQRIDCNTRLRLLGVDFIGENGRARACGYGSGNYNLHETENCCHRD
jgi:hypothetical protein